MGLDIRVQDRAFDPHGECAAFVRGRADAGALASFVGYCRDETAGRAVTGLTIQQYEGFTQAEIARLAAEVAARFGVGDLLVIHRVGAIAPGEAIVLVAALSVHRAAAFDAVRVLMDYLKTDAPLWKKEAGPDGARWIEPRGEDHQRRAAAETSA